MCFREVGKGPGSQGGESPGMREQGGVVVSAHAGGILARGSGQLLEGDAGGLQAAKALSSRGGRRLAKVELAWEGALTLISGCVLGRISWTASRPLG